MSLPQSGKDAAHPPAKTVSSEPAATETTRAAGRGGLAIAVAKVSFIFFGFAQQAILPRLLGVDGYGEVSLVLSAVSVLNNVIVATSIQGVSRAVSQVPEAEADQALRRALGVHAVLAIVVSAAFAALAGPIARFTAASQLTTQLRLVALVIFLYGVYAPLVGSLNGKRRFLDQAGLDIGYGALRLFAMVGGAMFFLRSGRGGVLGAVVGFIAAAAIIVPIALVRTGTGKPGGKSPALGPYLRFLLPLAVSQYFLNQLMQTDLLFLSRFVGQAAGMTDAGIKAANSLRGVYRGVQLFAFLPFQLLMSVTFVLFPLLARASAEGDRDAVRGYTMTGVRLGFVLTGLMCGAVSAIAPHVLHLVFPEEIWTQGGDALRILSLGMGAFSVLGITCAALSGLGRPTAAALLTALGVGLIAAGCVVLIPRAELGPQMLVHAAIATSTALAITAAAAGLVLRSVAGGFVSAATIVRVLGALGVAVAVGSRLPWLGKLFVPIEAVAVAALYVVVLVVTRELGPADLARVLTVVRRKAPGA
jgi:stage V sporulation protein B